MICFERVIDLLTLREYVYTGDFLEVYMRIPIEICEQRDPKGLYKAARAGKIKNFTGIDDPYEEPDKAELVVDARDQEVSMQGKYAFLCMNTVQIMQCNL